jgi:membrane associated rhomboid family serine protease
MGESDRYSDYGSRFRRSRFTLGQPSNALVGIITINIIFFLLILVSRVFYIYTHQGGDLQVLKFDAIEWFALPAKLTTLSEKPWTLLTFMFSHGGLAPFALLINMISNMLWLWAFGYILQDLAGNRLIFAVYIYGSLLGAVFFITACYLFPALKPQINSLFLAGSGMGNTAIAIAVTTLSPNYRFFKNLGNGIPVWILTGLFLLINFISALNGNNPTSFAIIGAALAGYLFIYLLKKGTDGSVWINNFYDWILNVFNPTKKDNTKTKKEKVFYNTGNRLPFNKKANVTQQRVDEILDKISQQGYHFLTDEEKNILKRASEE